MAKFEIVGGLIVVFTLLYCIESQHKLCRFQFCAILSIHKDTFYNVLSFFTRILWIIAINFSAKIQHVDMHANSGLVATITFFVAV
jgi:hypothetical protein